MNNKKPEIYLHDNDLPENFNCSEIVAIDTETTGLHPQRDRLCLIQIYNGVHDDGIHLVRIEKEQKNAPIIEKIIKDQTCTKLFHYARFDMAMIFRGFGIMPKPVYCTKIASKLVRTYTERHGLKELCDEMLSVNLSKHQQSTDWACEKLSDRQKTYAAYDVLYLHRLQQQLNFMLKREERVELANSCFDFLASRVLLDLSGWSELDIFAH